MSDKNRILLKDFLSCFDSNTQMELYTYSNAYDDIVYTGSIEGFINNLESCTEYLKYYSDWYVEPDSVKIQSSRIMSVIIDE